MGWDGIVPMGRGRQANDFDFGHAIRWGWLSGFGLLTSKIIDFVTDVRGQ